MLVSVMLVNISLCFKEVAALYLLTIITNLFISFFTANDEQVEKCKAVIKKLSFPYEPAQFENPALQKFYSNLEALALSRDEPDEIMDYTSK